MRGAKPCFAATPCSSASSCPFATFENITAFHRLCSSSRPFNRSKSAGELCGAMLELQHDPNLKNGRGCRKPTMHPAWRSAWEIERNPVWRKLLFVTCDTPPPVWPSASCVCCVQKNQLCDHPLAAAHFLAVTNFRCTNLGYGVSFPIMVTGEQMVRGGGQAGSAAESRARFPMAQLKTASRQVPQSKFPPTETQ